MRITEDYILDKNRPTKPALEELLIALILAVYSKTVQAVMLKSMVSDLR